MQTAAVQMYRQLLLSTQPKQETEEAEQQREELEKQNRLAEQRTLTFKPSLNSASVSVPGRLQLHTKAGLESYLDRIKVCWTPLRHLLRCDCALHNMSHVVYLTVVA